MTDKDRPGLRIGLFGAGLVAVFAVAFAAAGAIVPESTVDSWNQAADDAHTEPDADTETGHDGHDDRPAGLGTADTVAGYDLTVHGELTAGAPAVLTVTVERDGRAVTDLQPHLGAHGHLTVLREHDLAHLRVHPEALEPGSHAGPRIAFTATAPVAGTYLLYFEFRVGGDVHTARFAVTAR